MPDVTVALVVRDLTEADLEALQWSGAALHIAAVRKELDRVTSGEAEYLVAAARSDLPIGKAAIDYARLVGAGTVHQAAVHPALQSCGIGTLLFAEAERRIRTRGLAYAELRVEQNNPRARALYERLGYVAYGQAPDEWDELGPTGDIVRYHTVCTLMRKLLT